MFDIPAKRQTEAAGAPEILDIFGSTLAILLDGSTIPMVFGEEHVPSGFGVPMHVHEDDDELFYILDGELTVDGPVGKTKNQSRRLRKVASRRPARLTQRDRRPGAHARGSDAWRPGLEMLRHFDRAGRAARLAPNDIAAIAAQYGVRFV